MARGIGAGGAKSRMTLRFSTTLFVSAMLLFTCQPLVARMIVPLLGGAASVWIVCSLCFQALLLVGYAFAHVVGTRLAPRAQIAVQLALVLGVFLVLPITVDDAAASRLTANDPTSGLIVVLLRTVGLPFFVLATTSPLLQRWFAEIGEEDPYFLYASSNAGSMLALLGYPLLVEPWLTVRAQSRALQLGYVLYAGLLVFCAFATGRQRRAVAAPIAPPAPRAKARERLTWIALAFAPSSLLLGVTEYVTTDIASIPLLWVLPLAAYLASFIVAFARRQPVSEAALSRAFAFVVVLVTLLALGHLRTPPIPIIGMHVVLVFLAGAVCHRALANRRPHVTRLTEFYLLLSVGGVLGGLFNGLVAPLIFDDLYELPLAIGAAALGRAALERTPLERRGVARDVGLGALLGAVAFALAALARAFDFAPTLKLLVVFAVPVVVAFAWSKHPVRYSVALAGLLLVGMRETDDVLAIPESRNFFGVLKVGQDRAQRFRLLVYGRTVHGRQATGENARSVPLAYYHPSGPAGDVLAPGTEPRKIGVIGLGVGALAAYARPGDEWTFFEINPDVVTIAERDFSFLADARTRAEVSTEIGDGRLRLRDGASARFSVLVLDAFTSDAIPMHLLTREALAVYRRALRPGGVLLAHVSNLSVRLQPVFGALARDAGMFALERTDSVLTDEDRAAGKDASEWVLLSPSRVELPRWRSLEVPAAQPVWSDDFANVLGALR